MLLNLIMTHKSYQPYQAVWRPRVDLAAAAAEEEARVGDSEREGSRKERKEAEWEWTEQ